MFTRRAMLGAISAAALVASGMAASAQDKMYIPLISKGFQHQLRPE